MLNLLASVSQWEREAIGERTAFVLAHKRRERKVYGHVPFGFRRQDDDLVPDATEAAALKHIRGMRAEGYSLRDVAQWLTEQGIRPRQGGQAWYAASVSRVLSSRMASETT